MKTRSQLRKINLSNYEDIKPCRKLLDTGNVKQNCNVDFFKHDLKDCSVDLKEDIKIFKSDTFPKIEDCGVIENFSKETELEKTTYDIINQCQKCFKSYSEVGLLRHRCGTYQCDECGKPFTNRSKFDCHVRQHARIKQRKSLLGSTTCRICDGVVREQYMKRHMKIHQIRQTCNICGVILKRDKMQEHQMTHYKYKCNVCGKPNKSKENHNRHIQVHEKAKRHPCGECNASFQYLVELARHVTHEHRTIDEGKYECLFCKKIVSAIGHHLRTHEVNPTQCEKCEVKLPNYSAYKSHIRYHDILMKLGNTRTIIPRHLVVKRTEPLVCHYCEKIFKIPYLLKLHKCHLFFSTHPCPYCEINTFQSLFELIEHVSLTHQYIPDSHSLCPLCYQMVPDIEDHLLLHEPNQFECEICNITFNSCRNYKKHYNSHHKLKKSVKTSLHIYINKYASLKPNMTKVACLQCHEKVRISYLHNHLSGHQAFTCIMCQKKFYSQRLLELHEENHRRNSQRCPVCSQSFLSHIRLMAHLKMCHKMSFSVSKACSRCYI